jgi:hypothetical protein
MITWWASTKESPKKHSIWRMRRSRMKNKE